MPVQRQLSWLSSSVRSLPYRLSTRQLNVNTSYLSSRQPTERQRPLPPPSLTTLPSRLARHKSQAVDASSKQKGKPLRELIRESRRVCAQKMSARRYVKSRYDLQTCLDNTTAGSKRKYIRDADEDAFTLRPAKRRTAVEDSPAAAARRSWLWQDIKRPEQPLSAKDGMAEALSSLDSAQKAAPKRKREDNEDGEELQQPVKTSKELHLPENLFSHEEKRAHGITWKSRPSSSFTRAKQGALMQRLVILDRQRTGELEQTVRLSGSEGRTHTVAINSVPSCDCGRAQQGVTCKHVAYVLARVLHAPVVLQHQPVLTADELKCIFDNAPVLPSEKTRLEDGRPKAIEQGDACPVCGDGLETSRDAATHCRACGNCAHTRCLERWRARPPAGGDQMCPFGCRVSPEEPKSKAPLLKAQAKPAEASMARRALGGLPSFSTTRWTQTLR